MQTGNKNNNTNITLNIENITISTSKSMKLLEITIDNTLNTEKHISVLCKKAALQLKTISRWQKYMEKKEKEAIIISFIYYNINYGPLLGIFVHVNN